MNNPPRFLPQKVTSEALIGALKPQDAIEIRDSKTGEVYNPVVGAKGYIVNDELSTFLDRNSHKNGLIPMLTSLWDAHGEPIEYLTRSHGSEYLEEYCISMLGGTTANWLRESLPPDSVGGGFTSRIIFVYSEPSPRIVPRPMWSQEIQDEEDLLIHDLNEIDKIQGDYILTEQAARHFDEEYIKFRKTSELFDNKELSGYAGRRHTLMHKVAMALSASDRGDMRLCYSDYVAAEKLLQVTESKMPFIIRSIVASEKGGEIITIEDFIHKVGSVTRSQLVKKFSNKLSVLEIDMVMDTLLTAGVVETVVGRNNRQTYCWRE